ADLVRREQPRRHEPRLAAVVPPRRLDALRADPDTHLSERRRSQALRLEDVGSVRIAVVLVVSLLLATAFAGSANASASVAFGGQDDSWLASGPGTLESRLGTLDKLGIKTVRYTIQWDQVAPTRPEQPKWSGDPVYQWGSSDAVLKGLRAHGIDIVLEIRFTPSWANGGAKHNVLPTDGQDFANFVAAVQNRFPWVQRYLIWNEPNKIIFMNPISPKNYVVKLLNPA